MASVAAPPASLSRAASRAASASAADPAPSPLTPRPCSRRPGRERQREDEPAAGAVAGRTPSRRLRRLRNPTRRRCPTTPRTAPLPATIPWHRHPPSDRVPAGPLPIACGLESSWRRDAMDWICKIGLDGIRMLDPSTGRTLRIYPLDSLTRWEVLDSAIFAFWAKTSVDIEAKRIRLLESC